MGFAEIQAAFAANGAAPQPQPAPAPQAFAPSPFTVTPAQAPAFTPTLPQAPTAPVAFTPQPSVPSVATFTPPAQPAFQFTPPANAATPPNGGPWSPINPPGERVALGVPTANPPVAAAPVAAVGVTAAPTSAPTDASAVGSSVVEAPKRKRRTKAEMAAAQVLTSVANDPLVPMAIQADAEQALAHCELKDLPPDGSTVEDIVEELFARGVSSVHLTFTRDGK